MFSDMKLDKLIDKESMKPYIDVCCGVLSIYLGWIILHYLASHMYIQWCVPATLIGFITAPLLVPAPHCQALRWTIYNGGEKIFAMWVMAGTWLYNKITAFENKKK